jgi:hypothetical protein
MKTLQRFLRTSISSAATSLFAGVLEFKNGTVLNGTNADGNADLINFQTSAGGQASNALALTFTARTADQETALALAGPTLFLASADTLHGAGRNHLLVG